MATLFKFVVSVFLATVTFNSVADDLSVDQFLYPQLNDPYFINQINSSSQMAFLIGYCDEPFETEVQTRLVDDFIESPFIVSVMRDAKEKGFSDQQTNYMKGFITGYLKSSINHSIITWRQISFSSPKLFKCPNASQLISSR